MSRNRVLPLYTHWDPLTQNQLNILLLDFERFCSEGSMIIDKNSRAVKFQLNEAQIEVSRLLIKEVFNPTPAPVSLFIHKSRQMGISVVLAKLNQFLCTKRKHLNVQHIMPTEADADDLCEKKFIPQLQATHPSLLPEATAITRRVKFKSFGGIDLNSSVTFASAAKHSPGHGLTNQIAIFDECAFYEHMKRLERGMEPTIPKAGLSVKIYVSTANGMNHYYDMSKVAKTSPHWKYLFLPWHMLKEYEREPDERLKKLTNLTEYELQLCDIFEEYGYPVESWTRKMAWYNFVFETEAKLDKEHMWASYPSTAEESFAATGLPVLPTNKLRVFLESNPEFDYVEMTEDIQGRSNVAVTNISTIKRWKEPQKGRKYLIGVDPADGGEQGDFSAAVVIDLVTMENVCSIREKLDQSEFAELLNQVGRYYNRASIVVERNTGQTVIDWLVMLRYPNIFVDALKSTSTRVSYGVYMTPGIKKDSIARARFFLNNDIYKDYDKDFIEESMHFVWKKTPSGLRKAIGSEGHNDDTIMSRLIAFASLNMSKYRGWEHGKEQ